MGRYLQVATPVVFCLTQTPGRRAADIIVPSCVAKPLSRRLFYCVICRLALPYFYYNKNRPVDHKCLIGGSSIIAKENLGVSRGF